MKPSTAAALLCLAAVTATAPEVQAQPAEQAASMTFFVTSRGLGDGANLGALEGADRHCQMLAQAAGAGTRTWRAYLSVVGIVDREAIDARDRIGYGPWHNAEGVLIARNVEELHDEGNAIDAGTALTENADTVPRSEHDILTGSREDGRAFLDVADHTCADWTSNDEGTARLGHHDRRGDNTSWNSAHASEGCSQQDLRGTGGAGRFYCFATN